MARFVIQHCRTVDATRSEFDVQLLSGEIQMGDSFSCMGTFRHTEFRVQLVRQLPSHTTLVCAGDIAFENEFAGITLDTKVARLPRPDLPTSVHSPNPTAEEEQMLQRVIEDWEIRSPTQRAACLCLIRGDDTPERIGRSLGLTAEDVRKVLHGVCGVLYDSGQDKFFIR